MKYVFPTVMNQNGYVPFFRRTFMALIVDSGLLIIRPILRFFVASPFYPHWLISKKQKEGNRHILEGIYGDVVEVGAGDGQKKFELLRTYHGITSYIASDTSSWDDIFSEHSIRFRRTYGLSEILFGIGERIGLDCVCSATHLPFADESFDYHLSFEVLEHIDDPQTFFSEATRVLKKGGKIVLSVPYFYRIHGWGVHEQGDYFRYTPAFFLKMASLYTLDVIEIFVNTGIGTSIASLVNSWFIIRIRGANIVFKIFLLVLAPFVFFFSNMIGFFFDQTPDVRFATRFHVVLQKRP